MMTTKEDQPHKAVMIISMKNHSHKAIMIISMKNLTRHHKLLRCINHGRSLGIMMDRNDDENYDYYFKIIIII